MLKRDSQESATIRIGSPMEIASILHRISLPIGNTPIVHLDINVNGVKRLLMLKLEAYNPCGSLKDRVAAALIDSVSDRVDQDAGIVPVVVGIASHVGAPVHQHDPFVEPARHLRSHYRAGVSVAEHPSVLGL